VDLGAASDLELLPQGANATREAIGYIQVSSDEQADLGQGQRLSAIIFEAISNEGGGSMVTIFVDAGVSWQDVEHQASWLSIAHGNQEKTVRPGRR
jgi:hypothetical protein